MMKIYAVPAEGMKIPDPDASVTYVSKHLPPEGRWVEESVYWSRRFRDGDATQTEGPQEMTAELEPATPADEPESNPVPDSADGAKAW